MFFYHVSIKKNGTKSNMYNFDVKIIYYNAKNKSFNYKNLLLEFKIQMY